jgi:hypothetical protein
VHPFYVAVGVKGAAKVDVDDELMLGGYGRGKMNHVRLDWVQSGGGGRGGRLSSEAHVGAELEATAWSVTLTRMSGS